MSSLLVGVRLVYRRPGNLLGAPTYGGTGWTSRGRCAALFPGAHTAQRSESSVVRAAARHRETGPKLGRHASLGVSAPEPLIVAPRRRSASHQSHPSHRRDAFLASRALQRLRSAGIAGEPVIPTEAATPHEMAARDGLRLSAGSTTGRPPHRNPYWLLERTTRISDGDAATV